MIKPVIFLLVTLGTLGAGTLVVLSRQQSDPNALEVSVRNKQARELSVALAEQTQEKARIEELQLNLHAMSELLSRQLADCHAERDEADRKFDQIQAHIEAAIALDDERMKEVSKQVEEFTEHILALTERINKAVDGSEEQERLIHELATLNAKLDTKADEAKCELDELNTRQDNLRLTLNSLNEELGIEKGQAEKCESEASALLKEVREMKSRIAVLNFNITWYEKRRVELKRIIAMKRQMNRIGLKFKTPFGDKSIDPRFLLGPELPIISSGHPPIEIGGPGGGVHIGGHKVF